MSLQEFADRIKRLRRRAGLTQTELAIAADMSPQMISKLENNKPPPETRRPNAIKLCRAVGWTNIDEALALLGYPPLDDDEQGEERTRRQLWFDLEKLWPRLDLATQQQIVDLAADRQRRTHSGRGLRIVRGTGQVPKPRDNNTTPGGDEPYEDTAHDDGDAPDEDDTGD